MTRRVSTALVRFATLLLALAGVDAEAGPRDVAAFERLTREYFEQFLATHPEEATRLGDHRFDRRTSDVSTRGIAADRALYHRTLARLEAIPAAALPIEDAVDRDILAVDLRARLFDIEVLETWRWEAIDYSPVQGIYVLLARDYAPLKQRLAAANERLKAIPRIVAAARANLRRPPRVFTETAIAQNKGAIAFVRDDLDEYVGREPSMGPVLAKSRARAVAALTDYGAWLERELLPRSDGDFRFGREHFEERLRYTLDSDLSADEVLRRAEANVATVQAAMEEAAIPLHEQYFPDQPIDGFDRRQIVRRVLDRIAERHPDNATVVAGGAGATSRMRPHSSGRIAS